jgi:hypothetical protein
MKTNKTLFEVLLDIQQNLVAPKDQYNSFGKYSYRSCEQILKALKPHLSKHNAVILFDEEIIEQNGWHYVKATAKLCVVGSEEFAKASAYAREDETRKGMDASQITGSASSYARKYALNALFAIDDVKDSDATNTHGKEQADPAPEKPTPAKPAKPADEKIKPTQEEFTAKINSINSEQELRKYWATIDETLKDNYRQIITNRNKELKK